MKNTKRTNDVNAKPAKSAQASRGERLNGKGNHEQRGNGLHAEAAKFEEEPTAT